VTGVTTPLFARFEAFPVVVLRVLVFRIIILHSGQFNLLKPTGHVMHHQFNIQQLYALPTLYICVLYLSENKQRLVPLTT